MSETRQVRQGGCRNDDTFRDFYFANAKLIFFVSTDAFESRRNVWFGRSDPLSLTTTTQADETCRFTTHIHPRPLQALRHPHLHSTIEIETVR